MMLPFESAHLLLIDQLRAGLMANLRLADALELHLVGAHLDSAWHALSTNVDPATLKMSHRTLDGMDAAIAF